jgi:hypothetical protein
LFFAGPLSQTGAPFGSAGPPGYPTRGLKGARRRQGWKLTLRGSEGSRKGSKSHLEAEGRRPNLKPILIESLRLALI